MKTPPIQETPNPTVMGRNQHRIKALIREAHEVRPGEGRLVEQVRTTSVADALIESDVEDRVLIGQSADRLNAMPKAQALELLASIGTLLDDVLGEDPEKLEAVMQYVRERQTKRVRAERATQIELDARNAGH